MPVQDSKDEALIRRAFVYFSVVSAGLIVVVVIGVLLIARFLSQSSAAAEATTRGEVVAAVVETGLGSSTEGPLDAELADSVEQTAAQAGVRAVVLWDESGNVVWSTRESLIDATFELEPELRRLFGSTEALTADPGEELENARPTGLLGNEVAVFTPITDPQGRPLLVQTYVDAASLDGLGSAPLLILLPLGVAALILFEGVALMMGTRLARRVQSSRRERIKLLTASLGAVENERRRLAHDLHDGIVQDLAATRYALTAVMQTVPADLPGSPRSRLARVCELLGEELHLLRSMLGEMLPPETLGTPRPQVFRALVDRLVPEGIDWSVELDEGVATVDPTTLEMAHRVVREGVRNAVRHARPTHIAVRVTTGGDGDEWVRVEVDDYGVGPPVDEGDPDGPHYGLRLLRGLVLDLDGHLRLLSLPDGGARLVAEWPLPSAGADDPASRATTTTA